MLVFFYENVVYQIHDTQEKINQCQNKSHVISSLLVITGVLRLPAGRAKISEPRIFGHASTGARP